MRLSWSRAWSERPFRRAMIGGLLAALPIVLALPLFFDHIGARPGRVPWDPLMAAIGPMDVTWITFTVLYGGIAFTLFRIAKLPQRVLRGVHAYVILQLFRMACMEMWTLEPPPAIIPLIDPVTAVFYPGGVPFLKDLFFSGHTATLALMVCLLPACRERLLMIVATTSVGALVIVQHVHWTVDVLAAPVFVWLAWKASAFSLRRCGVAVA